MSLSRSLVLSAAAVLLLAAGAASAQRSCRRPTGRDVEGPYYIPDAPVRGVADSTETKVCSNVEEAYHRIVIYGRVLGRVSNDTRNPRCVPLRALLDVWQANEAGEYSQRSSMHCRAKFVTTEDGQFLFQSIFPGRYDDNGFRPAHLHWKITAVDDARFKQTLTTQSYFEGDYYLNPVDSCPVCSSGDPSLIAKAVNIHVPEGTSLRSQLSPRRDIMTFAAEWDIVLDMDAVSAVGLLDDELDLAPGSPYTQRLPHILVPESAPGAAANTEALIRELRALRKENVRLRRETVGQQQQEKSDA